MVRKKWVRQTQSVSQSIGWREGGSKSKWGVVIFCCFRKELGAVDFIFPPSSGVTVGPAFVSVFSTLERCKAAEEVMFFFSFFSQPAGGGRSLAFLPSRMGG